MGKENQKATSEKLDFIESADLVKLKELAYSHIEEINTINKSKEEQANEFLETIEELKAELAKSKEDINSQNKLIENQTTEFLETIQELKSELVASKVGGAVQKVVVTHEKKNFEVTIPSFRWKGKVIKAIELKGFPEIIAEILSDEGQTLLVEVKK